MILGGKAIFKAFTTCWQARRNGKCMTKDQLNDAIGPNSFDVTLGQRIMHQKACVVSGVRQYPSYKEIDPHKSIKYFPDNIGNTGFSLYPGQFILGVTQEKFNTDKPVYLKQSVAFGKHTSNPPMFFVQKYDGRSTMGRLGIASHVTAGFGDYSFKDYWTLELVNLGGVPVILYAGMRIGQISFEQVHEPLEYQGAYTDVSDLPMPKAPKLGKDRF